MSRIGKDVIPLCNIYSEIHRRYVNFVEFTCDSWEGFSECLDIDGLIQNPNMKSNLGFLILMHILSRYLKPLCHKFSENLEGASAQKLVETIQVILGDFISV